MQAREALPPSRAPGSCLTCPQCSLPLESLALRCPRCAAPIELGCSGNCRECGEKR
jgi:hypothetical protein